MTQVVRLLLVASGWFIVSVLAVVIAARAIAWDRWRLFADVDAAVEVLFLPAWIVMACALLRRRWFLSAAAAFICLAQVIYVAPELLADQPLPPGVSAEPSLRLFDANVYQRNHSMAGYAAQIKSDHPQLVTMEETLPGDWGQLQADGAFQGLPFHFRVACCGSRGFILASRYPLKSIKVSEVEGEAYMVRSVLQLPTRSIPLWVVHTDAPVNPEWDLWNLQLDGIYRQLQAVHPRPLLMVGDFNATWGNRGFRAILSTGLTDAAAARGQPFAFTWSQLLGVLPPFLRIDHVLTAGDLTVTSIGTHPGPGSEHRDITVSVALG